jgi:hypothetical protein
MNLPVMRMRVAMLASLAAVVSVGLVVTVVFAAASPPASFATWRPPDPTTPGATQPAPLVASPTTPPPPPPLPTLAAPADPATIKASGARLFGWAFLDRRTGKAVGSANAGTVTNTVESMIKPWIAADYLRRLAEKGDEPSARTRSELTLMIVDSNDPLTEKYYRLGGADAVVRRMISICGLRRVSIRSSQWSWTLMTPQDTVRYGQCLADGRAAGPEWTPWILEAMTKVRGKVTDQRSGAVQGGRWGIIDGLPPELAKTTSIKNGWTLYRDGWHVNCLAVHQEWVLGIMIRTTRGLQAAADICKSVTTRLVVNP